MISIAPTQSNVLAALRSFLLAVLPPQTDALAAIENRVPQPAFPNFALMTPVRFGRIETNFDQYSDVKFTGSIAAAATTLTGSIAPAPAAPANAPSSVLTVTATSGPVVIGAPLAGTGVLANTTVTGQLSGPPGGIGTYSVTPAQSLPSSALSQSYGLMTVSAVATGSILPGLNLWGVGVATGSVIASAGTGTGGAGTYFVVPSQTLSSETLSSGYRTLQQNAMVTVQVDFHSIDGSSADMAQTVATTFRDPFGTEFFAALAPPGNGVVPLYADDPKQMPYQNENQQWEWRWVVEANMQINQTVIVPQQYADVAEIELVDVDASYPPS